MGAIRIALRSLFEVIVAIGASQTQTLAESGVETGLFSSRVEDRMNPFYRLPSTGRHHALAYQFCRLVGPEGIAEPH